MVCNFFFSLYKKCFHKKNCFLKKIFNGFVKNISVMENFISEIKKMKIFVLPCTSNEDYPRKHNSEDNWKLLKNMTKALYT